MDYFQCGNPPGSGCPFGRQTVSEYMGTSVAAISQTPSRYGKMVTFFAGSGLPGSAVPGASRSAGGPLNESTVFHEALHGYTGLDDNALIQGLGITDEGTYRSTSITYYIELNIFGASLHYFDPGGNAPLVCQQET